MKKILFLVQLPPPVHGAAIANEIVVNSQLIAGQYESRCINIVSADMVENIGRFSLSKLPGVIRSLAAIIRNLMVFRPDIVYISLSPSGFAFYRDVIYVYIVRLFRPEVVFHLHGKGLRSGMQRSRLFRRLCKSIFRNSSVIFLSEGLRSDADGLVYKKEFIVNYGLPGGAVGPKNDVEGKVGKKILYLSNYVRTKGVLDLVDALEVVARTHRPFKVSLTGKPYDISREFLQDYVKSKGLADIVDVTGPKYGDDKARLLADSDIFVLPTYYENEAFPLSLLEAMSYGLAVISTYEGGIPDMIDDGVNGLLYPQRDVSALAEQLVFLLDDPEKVNSLGVEARKKFLDRFTVSIFERNMLEVFRQICPQDQDEQ